VSRPHSSRGQILPVWIVAILTILILTFMAINYGNTLRWQMRAQNAADAAAQAVMAIQTQHFNELSAALYATNVEEFRIRCYCKTACSTRSTERAAAPARPPSPKAKGQALFLTGSGTCDQVFNTLLPYYEEAVVRYGADVAQLNNVATLTTLAIGVPTVRVCSPTSAHPPIATPFRRRAVVSDGGDCQFQYKLNGIGYRRGLNALGSGRLQRRVSRARRYLGEQCGNGERAAV
jgi:hypothetical protein